MSAQKRKQKKAKGKKKGRKSPSRPLPPEGELLPDSLIDIRVEGATVPQWRTGD